MKNFLIALFAICFCLPLAAQKTQPSKSNINNVEVDKTKESKNSEKNREEEILVDSVKFAIDMEKPLDQYFDSLKLSKEQMGQIAEIGEMEIQREGMTRAKSKMTKAEISAMEKENLYFRNNKIYEILTIPQTKEIYLLQNGKLKTGRDIEFVIAHLELKPSQQEQIKRIQSEFTGKFDKVNEIEDELERVKSTGKLNSEIEKQIKSVLDKDQAQRFDEIKSGKIDPTTDKDKKEMEKKAMENQKKG